MTVRIEPWVAQLCGDTLLEPLRDEMFEALRFLVNLFERVIQHFVEEGFDKAMMTKHLKRPSFACR